MDLQNFVRDPATGIDAIAAALDAMRPAERRAAAHALGRADQRLLYQKAAQSRAMTLDDFVPAATPPQTPVVHYGRNTLPLPPSLKLFAKVFARPADGSARLFGYNDSALGWLVGPGFYVAVPSTAQASWPERGAVVIDYFLEPDGPVPAGWPTVVPNSKGLSRFVYYHTRDFMRRVSAHVSIGAAYKEENPLDHYFILVRE